MFEMALDFLERKNKARLRRAQAAASCTQTNDLSMSLTAGGWIVFRIDLMHALRDEPV